MPVSVPIKQLVGLDLSSDGRFFLVTAEMQTGERANFSIPLKGKFLDSIQER
jgi:hypothetical protein